MPKIELKPCPWGGPAQLQSFLTSYRVIGNCDVCENHDCKYIQVWERASWSNMRDCAVEAWNRRAGDQPKRRRDRRNCVHFRFPTAEIAHVWCAKHGPHYDCLGAHGCQNYAEPVLQAENMEGGSCG